MSGLDQRCKQSVQRVARKTLIVTGGQELMTIAEGRKAFARRSTKGVRLGDGWNRPWANGINVEKPEAT